MLLKIHACKFTGWNNQGKHMQSEKQTELPFVCFFEVFSICTICHNPPLLYPHKQTHFLLQELHGCDRSHPHASQRQKGNRSMHNNFKKSLPSHICLQQGPVFQSNHIYNGVTIALLFQNIHVAWAVQGLRCAALMCTLTPVPQLAKLQMSWAFLLSIGFNTDMLPLTSIKPLSRNMLPRSASWFVFKWSSSHKPNDSLQFYKHIHVCCQTHELVFCRLLQESNH